MENLSLPQNLRTGFMIRPEKVRTCPSCGSYFITDIKCEDCGFVPFEERLGSPYGEKSFYSIKARYWEAAPFWMRHFPFLEPKTSTATAQYKKVLLLRYRHLLDFFATTASVHPDRKHFYQELTALVDELLCYPISLELLTNALPHLEDGRLNVIFEEIGRRIEMKKNKKAQSLSSAVGGTWNLNLIIFLVMVGTWTGAALILYPYLLVR